MKQIKMKKIIRTMMALAIVMACASVFSLFAFAADTPAVATGGDNVGLGLIAAALSTGIAGIGAGIAVGAGAPAAIGALTEDAKTFSKSLIFVVLGEGIALYGMLVSILILAKI